MCHLEAAAPSRSAASEEPRGGNTSRSRECAFGRGERLGPSQTPPPALATPAPRPRPRRCRLSCGGPGGGGSSCRRRHHTRYCLWSFSSCAGEMSSVLFLYWAFPRFRGPGAAHWPHPLHLHRAPPPAAPRAQAAALRAVLWAKRSVEREAGGCLCGLNIYACVCTYT